VGATDFLGRGKPISPRGGSRLPTYNKEDNKEDSKKDEPVVLPYGSDFKVAWDKWEAYRKQTKKPLTAMTRVEQVKMLGDLQNEKQAIATIDKSIAFGWQGLFVTKQDNTKYKAPLTNQDHANGF
jgi:hypothetical protein